MAENVQTIGSGKDFTTVTGWETDTDVALTTGTVEVGELYDSADWTANDIIAGASNIDATTYRMLRAATADRHNGTVGSGGVEFNPSSGGHILQIDEDNFRIDGLIMGGMSNSSDECCRINNTGFRAQHCIFYNAESNTLMDALYISVSSATIYISNCIFYEFTRGAVHVQGQTSVTVYVHNCTGWELVSTAATQYCGFGFDDTKNNNGSVMHCDNVTSHSTNRADFQGGGTGGNEGTVNCTNCASSDSTTTSGQDVTDVAGNLNTVTQSDQFVNLTTIDLHLKAGADLLLAGKDLSGDSDLPVTDDIDYATRTGTYDIGAHQLSAGGGGLSIPIAAYHYNHHIGSMG